MRILHFNQFGTYAGGVEGYINDVSRALISAGHLTQLVSFASAKPEDLMPGTVQVDASDPGEILSGITRVVESFRPDVAYIHAVYDPRIVRWIVDLVPSIAYIHSPYLVCPGYALFLRRSAKVCERAAGPVCLLNAQLERCCFGVNPMRHLQRLRQVRSLLKATAPIRVVVGSRFMKDRLIANGLPSGRIDLLPPVVLAEPISVYTPPSDPTTLLFSGRLVPEKGPRQLIEALATVNASWRLIVAGDGPERAVCEQLARRLQVAHLIEFAGWVSSAQMTALYRRCAFVVVPSLWPEPYGRIGPEAFANGRPVVAYAVGGIPDWLDDGETGYLAIAGDIGSLRAAIMRLLGSREDQVRMGKTAQELARLRWSAETHVQKLVALCTPKSHHREIRS